MTVARKGGKEGSERMEESDLERRWRWRHSQKRAKTWREEGKNLVYESRNVNAGVENAKVFMAVTGGVPAGVASHAFASDAASSVTVCEAIAGEVEGRERRKRRGRRLVVVRVVRRGVREGGWGGGRREVFARVDMEVMGRWSASESRTVVEGTAEGGEGRDVSSPSLSESSENPPDEEGGREARGTVMLASAFVSPASWMRLERDSATLPALPASRESTAAGVRMSRKLPRAVTGSVVGRGEGRVRRERGVRERERRRERRRGLVEREGRERRRGRRGRGEGERVRREARSESVESGERREEARRGGRWTVR